MNPNSLVMQKCDEGAFQHHETAAVQSGRARCNTHSQLVRGLFHDGQSELKESESTHKQCTRLVRSRRSWRWVKLIRSVKKSEVVETGGTAESRQKMRQLGMEVNLLRKGPTHCDKKEEDGAAWQHAASFHC